MDGSAYAFAHGVRLTRQTLARWNRRPLPVVGEWVAGSAAAAVALLVAVGVIAAVVPGHAIGLHRPPFVTGDDADVLRVLGRNLLVLALHAMACVAGFIAASSLPAQARQRRGLARVVHERGGRLAIAFVLGATLFSLSAQALVIGTAAANVASSLRVSGWLLLVALLPHALPELTALFLPLAAWILASRRGQWDELLAATVVTVALAVPVLVASALVEVFVAPHLVHALIA